LVCDFTGICSFGCLVFQRPFQPGLGTYGDQHRADLGWATQGRVRYPHLIGKERLQIVQLRAAQHFTRQLGDKITILNWDDCAADSISIQKLCGTVG
jgi:hypothetical protein